MKSIKSKIMCILLTTVILLSVCFGVISSYLNYRTSIGILEKNITETAKITADRINYEIQSYVNVALEAGGNPALANPDASRESKKKIIDERVEAHNFQRGNIIRVDGISLFDGEDYSDRDYFQASMNGETYISDPLISKITGKLSIIISAPLWANGIPNSNVIGVVYFVPNEEFLNDIVSSIHIGESGAAYMINKEGLTIASVDSAEVGVKNSQEVAKTDPNYIRVAEIEKLMMQGESGFAAYTYGNDEQIIGYAPIPNSNGWSVGIYSSRNEFLSGVQQAILFTILLTIVFIAIGIIVSIGFSNSISKPIKACADRMRLLAQGDLQTPVPQATTKDETGLLLLDLKDLIDELKGSIGDVSHHLKEMSQRNFSTEFDREYKGDFAALKTSIQQISDSLNDVLVRINHNAEQVAVGSDQVASGAHALSQGATEQASAIEQLSASIAEVSQQVQQNAANSKNASEKAKQAGTEISTSNLKMQEMKQAMLNISSKSDEIGKIIKTIEDIAFQTNILALNAAVEAARAGVAGRGFAVVAGEVRNLAGKSAEAAKNTTQLIEDSIHAIKDGTDIAEETAKSMLAVVDIAQQVTQVVENISDASDKQAESIGQITQGIEQISSVVQTNSATAEQSAAASSQLSNQASILKNLVGAFRLHSSKKRDFLENNHSKTR